MARISSSSSVARISAVSRIIVIGLAVGWSIGGRPFEAVAQPSRFQLDVPFTTQAPHARWDEEHNEFCEEASVLMVARFWQRKGISGPNDAERTLQRIQQWEMDTFGYYKDTTAKETAQMLSERYKLKNVVVIKRPTVEDLKRELAAGRPVIVPAAGQQLGNPYFTPPGPKYHMLVLTGYRRDGKFVTNDPGTRRGEGYVYDASVIMKAMHDWNGGRVDRGSKVVIVVRG